MTAGLTAILTGGFDRQVVHEDVVLMKIDVEGFEARVLDGARGLLCHNVVQRIELEFTTVKRNDGCSPHKLLCWLQALGHEASPLESSPDASPLTAGRSGRHRSI